jgi:hypothetical protein
MIERTDDILASGIWETERMANIDAIVTCVEKDWK